MCYKTKPEELSVPYHSCMLTSAAAIVAELASDRKMWPYSGSHVRTMVKERLVGALPIIFVQLRI
jgi:hypothetical protein